MRTLKTVLAVILLAYATLAAFTFPVAVARGRPFYFLAGTAAGLCLAAAGGLALFRSAYPRKRPPPRP